MHAGKSPRGPYSYTARIDAGAVSTQIQWVHPAQIVDAAREQVAYALTQHPVHVSVRGDVLVRLDPRLTSAGLAHLLDNAAKYSPAGASIDVDAAVADGELLVSVRDRGAVRAVAGRSEGIATPSNAAAALAPRQPTRCLR